MWAAATSVLALAHLTLCHGQDVLYVYDNNTEPALQSAIDALGIDYYDSFNGAWEVATNNVSNYSIIYFLSDYTLTSDDYGSHVFQSELDWLQVVELNCGKTELDLEGVDTTECKINFPSNYQINDAWIFVKEPSHLEQLKLYNLHFKFNFYTLTALSYYGVVVYVDLDGTSELPDDSYISSLVVDSCSFEDNFIYPGESTGFMISVWGNNRTSVTITNTNFTGTDDGVIRIESAVQVTLSNVVLSDVYYNDNGHAGTSASTRFLGQVSIANTDGEVVISNMKANGCDAYVSCLYITNDDGVTSNVAIDGYECIDCVADISRTYSYAGGLVVRRASDVTIDNLHLEQCVGYSTAAAMYIWSVDTFTMRDSYFGSNTASYYTIVELWDITTTTMETTKFEDNSLNAVEFYETDNVEVTDCEFIGNSDDESGAAIEIYSDVEITIKNSRFVNNSATKFGGAIRSLYSDVKVDSCYFEGNLADNGGAIAYADWNFSGSFAIYNSSFVRNIAQSSGGAYYVFSGEFEWIDNECIDNQAKVSGGCIHDITSMLDCDSSGFRSNSRLINSTFKGNKARAAGAAYLTPCVIEIDSCQVLENRAYIVGGAFIVDSIESDYTVSNCNFTNNFAGIAGGSMLLTGGKISIDNNVYSSNRAGSTGGAVMIQGMEFNTNNSLTSDSNTGSIVADIADTTFAGNSARLGGALMIETINLNSGASGASATSGSADTAVLRVDSSNITDNEADEDGGALYVSSGIVSSDRSIFAANTAGISGGSVYFADNGGSYADRQSVFKNNDAGFSGGGIFAESEDITLVGSKIISNSAEEYGGGVYFEVEGTCLSNGSLNVTIRDNSAGITGGGYYLDSTDCDIDDWCEGSCSNEGNEAAFGADFGTSMEEMEVEWEFEDMTVTRVSQVEVSAAVLDAFGRKVTAFENEVNLQAEVRCVGGIGNSACEDDMFELDGNSINQFDPNASLSFKIVPLNGKDEWQYENNGYRVNVTVVAKESLSDSNLGETLFSVTQQIEYKTYVYELSDLTISIAWGLASLSLVSLFLTLFFLIRFIKRPVITGGNVYFLFLILFGVLVAIATMPVLVYTPFELDCRVLTWLIHFAFVLIVMPLVGKTWQMYVFWIIYKNYNATKEEIDMDESEMSKKGSKDSSNNSNNRSGGATIKPMDSEDGGSPRAMDSPVSPDVPETPQIRAGRGVTITANRGDRLSLATGDSNPRNSGKSDDMAAALNAIHEDMNSPDPITPGGPARPDGSGGTGTDLNAGESGALEDAGDADAAGNGAGAGGKAAAAGEAKLKVGDDSGATGKTQGAQEKLTPEEQAQMEKQKRDLARIKRKQRKKRLARKLARNQRNEFRWSSRTLILYFLVAPCVLVFGYLMAWSYTQDWEVIYNIDNQTGEVLKECPTNEGFFTVSLMFSVLCLILLVRLAISTRKVPKNFNESFWLGACIYTMGILFIFMIPLSMIDTIDIETKYVFYLVSIFLIINSLLVFLYMIKFLTICGLCKSDKFKHFDKQREHKESTYDTGSTYKSETSSGNSERSLT